MYIEDKELFKSRLLSGINIFAGAGFSVLPNLKGMALPTADELCVEVVEEFKLTADSSKGIEYISELCPTQDYQDFLRKRFTVEEYNPLYKALEKINLKTFVTTNIDNTIRLMFDDSSKYYLRSIREYGASMRASNELTFIPLHGDVSDPNSFLYFKKFDLAVVNEDNYDLFDQMYSLLINRPLLFIGYSFKDSGVLNVVKKLLDRGAHDIWVQFLSDKEENIELFTSKGCKKIFGDTKEILEWINSNLTVGDQKKEELILDGSLKRYRIPTSTSVVAIPQKDYFQQGITGWHPILSDIPYERKLVSEMENAALKYNRIIVSGNLFSGKTTALMQLARKINSPNKFYIDNVTKEEAAFICNKIGNNSAWIFFSNCCNDIGAYLNFASKPNIKLVGTADSYQLETVKHLLDQNVVYKVIDSNEIEKNEAIKVYQKIPVGLRNSPFSYKHTSDEKYSMLELIAQNVANAYTKKQIKKMLGELYSKNKDYFIIVALTAYLSKNQSALSYINISNILNVKVYPDAVNLITFVKDFLRESSLIIEPDEYEQDYFILRSKLFEVNVIKVLTNEYRKDFADIIKRFTINESQYNILRYDIFRRKAYDAELFKKLFTKQEADEIYLKLYNRDNNPYTLQQWALCQGMYGDFTNAFKNIDKALSMRPSNFSFKNSQAIIMFQANTNKHSQEAFNYMKKAMEILRECYNADKRKLYHAQKFAEFALDLHYKYSCDDYLLDAQKWLFEMGSTDVVDSPKTKELKENLSKILSKI